MCQGENNDPLDPFKTGFFSKEKAADYRNLPLTTKEKRGYEATISGKSEKDGRAGKRPQT